MDAKIRDALVVLGAIVASVVTVVFAIAGAIKWLAS